MILVFFQLPLQNLILKTLGHLFVQMCISLYRDNVRDLPVQSSQIVSNTIPNLLLVYICDDNKRVKYSTCISPSQPQPCSGCKSSIATTKFIS